MESRLPAFVARGRPSELFPAWLLGRRPAELSAWYRETYEKQAKRDEELAKKEADAARHPGREWRAGRAQEPGVAAPPRDPAAHAKRSMRFKVPGEVRPGEQWTHPGGTGTMWPGVSASHRANPVPPKLTGGEDLPALGYCWVPLARRVDLDRVVNTLLEFPSIFRNVESTGEGSSGYKREPWPHMNPIPHQLPDPAPRDCRAPIVRKDASPRQDRCHGLLAAQYELGDLQHRREALRAGEA